MNFQKGDLLTVKNGYWATPLKVESVDLEDTPDDPLVRFESGQAARSSVLEKAEPQ